MSHALSINPATEEIMAKFEYLDEKKAIIEVKKSRTAFAEWSARDVKERGTYLRKAATVLKKNSRWYGETISKEMGKPIKQAVAEVEKCAWACEYYADNAEEFLKDEMVKIESGKSYVIYQPLGTILGVMPWNFPFWQVFRFASSTLAAGNTIVVKHSSNVPQCGIAIEEVFREAGFPDYVYKNLIISSDTVKSLVTNDCVEGLSFTGSTEAGSKIGELAGRNIKKTVLELGSNDPFIILSNSDPKAAAEVAVTARFQNAGQSCIAAKRFIIHSDVAEEFKETFVKHTEKLVIGDPIDEKTTLGPLARDDLRGNLENQLNLMLKERTKILTGGKRIDGKGYFFQPTVVEAIKDSKTVMNEETFGPLASILIGDTDEELLRIANLSKYGLGASVWCSDRNRAESFARKVEAGMVVVNGMVKSAPCLPFGGIKKSGIGRELGKQGIREFVNVKSVLIY